jgi:hypothetical protein
MKMDEAYFVEARTLLGAVPPPISELIVPPNQIWNWEHQDQQKICCQIGDEAIRDWRSGDNGMLYPPRKEELFSHEKILTPRRQSWRIIQMPR